MMFLEKQEASNLRAIPKTPVIKILTYTGTPICTGTLFGSNNYHMEAF